MIERLHSKDLDKQILISRQLKFLLNKKKIIDNKIKRLEDKLKKYVLKNNNRGVKK